MLFHSFEFLVLLTITVMIFYLFPKQRVYLLGLANIIFYGVSGINYLILFMAVAFITYITALKSHSKWGKAYFIAGIVANIANLAFFKYTGFILRNLNSFLNIKFPWEDTLLAKIILPVGISFYTFQLIAYLVDARKGEVKPCKSFLEFWVFISFFGQLIAGPIMRGHEFLPQIQQINDNGLNIDNLKYGIYYIIMGLSKKIIFADYLGPRVQFYYSQVGNLNSLDAWFATYLFAFQIYFDFSAYSEIAVGIGHLFGLKLSINFKTPYLSGNPAEFWKRWHITLSSWIKDYIYIPLGGSRKGEVKQYTFLIIAMAISGLWHGAAWTFIIWGIYHGMLSAAHKFYTKWLRGKEIKILNTKVYKVMATFIFFQLVNIGWVFFRAQSFNDALFLIRKMVTFSDVIFDPVYIFYFGFIAFLYVAHIFEYLVRENELKIGKFTITYIPEYVRAALYVSIFVILVLFTRTEQSSFIYFQF